MKVIEANNKFATIEIKGTDYTLTLSNNTKLLCSSYEQAEGIAYDYVAEP